MRAYNSHPRHCARNTSLPWHTGQTHKVNLNIVLPHCSLSCSSRRWLPGTLYAPTSHSWTVTPTAAYYTLWGQTVSLTAGLTRLAGLVVYMCQSPPHWPPAVMASQITSGIMGCSCSWTIFERHATLIRHLVISLKFNAPSKVQCLSNCSYLVQSSHTWTTTLEITFVRRYLL